MLDAMFKDRCYCHIRLPGVRRLADCNARMAPLYSRLTHMACTPRQLQAFMAAFRIGGNGGRQQKAAAAAYDSGRKRCHKYATQIAAFAASPAGRLVAELLEQEDPLATYQATHIEAFPPHRVLAAWCCYERLRDGEGEQVLVFRNHTASDSAHARNALNLQLRSDLSFRVYSCGQLVTMPPDSPNHARLTSRQAITEVLQFLLTCCPCSGGPTAVEFQPFLEAHQLSQQQQQRQAGAQPGTSAASDSASTSSEAATLLQWYQEKPQYVHLPAEAGASGAAAAAGDVVAGKLAEVLERRQLTEARLSELAAETRALAAENAALRAQRDQRAQDAEALMRDNAARAAVLLPRLRQQLEAVRYRLPHACTLTGRKASSAAAVAPAPPRMRERQQQLQPLRQPSQRTRVLPKRLQSSPSPVKAAGLYGIVFHMHALSLVAKQARKRLLCAAAFSGHAPSLETALAHCGFTIDDRELDEAVSAAALAGHLAACERLLHSHEGEEGAGSTADVAGGSAAAAGEGGGDGLLDRMLLPGPQSRSGALEAACARLPDYCRRLRVLHAAGMRPSPEAVEGAVWGGHADALAYLWDEAHVACRLGQAAFQALVMSRSRGSVPVLRLLQSRGMAFTAAHVRLAAQRDDWPLDSLLWLLAQGHGVVLLLPLVARGAAISLAAVAEGGSERTLAWAVQRLTEDQDGRPPAILHGEDARRVLQSGNLAAIAWLEARQLLNTAPVGRTPDVDDLPV
eukprot:XP_001698963.1 predicted protein [Chlamydomonas reinhardtii]